MSGLSEEPQSGWCGWKREESHESWVWKCGEHITRGECGNCKTATGEATDGGSQTKVEAREEVRNGSGYIFVNIYLSGASLVAQMVMNLPVMQETQVRSLGGEDPLEKGMATHCQYSCLENSMDREAWWATVPGVGKSPTQPSDLHVTLTHVLYCGSACLFSAYGLPPLV